MFLPPQHREDEKAKVEFSADLRICGPKGSPLEVRTDGTITGASIIHLPGAYPPPILAQLRILCRGLGATRSTAAFGRWLKWLTAIGKKHPKETHYYLEFIGVDPPLQGRGLGSLMLERLVGWADRDRTGCYLETGNPRNVPLYLRFGFETVAEEDIIGVHTWFMWRPAA